VARYSPARRTALVLCGTGAHGAYHAGVLRAIQEAGVKIDVVAGHGIGAASAALAAIDGGSRLWDATGLWRGPGAGTLYRWKTPLRIAGWIVLVLVIVMLAPLLLLSIGLIVYPVGFIAEMFGASAGRHLIAAYTTWLQTSFASEHLPTTVPRAVLTGLITLVLVIATGILASEWRAPVRRRSRGRWWWRIFGSPLDAAGARALFSANVWHLIRGAAPAGEPPAETLGRRYAEVLSENLGQPGFRELVIVAHDIDTRRDLVAALLRDEFRRDFAARRSGRARQAEALDLRGIGRNHAIDIVAGALGVPFATDPQLVTFAADSYWRGETHRLCDRPGAVLRLLDELREIGVEQAVVVTAVPLSSGPHRLTAPRLELRHRLGELMSSYEAAALRAALDATTMNFEALYVVAPRHNPVGPFDFAGAYDESSDRRQTIVELMERGYEDAYRQFVEPVVGASGEDLDIGEAHGQRIFDDTDSSR
jgi:hypothetical protein